MATAADHEVWGFAKANGFAIVSKDLDFQQRALLLGHPPKVVWLRVGNCSTTSVAALLRRHKADLLAFDADPAASFLALS
jgi:predicted nuclease of predicted toxin-antitoxin system